MKYFVLLPHDINNIPQIALNLKEMPNCQRVDTVTGDYSIVATFDGPEKDETDIRRDIYNEVGIRPSICLSNTTQNPDKY
jgi:hypothetical protein